VSGAAARAGAQARRWHPGVALDRLLGRVSMYTLVLWALLALVGIAFVMSLFGAFHSSWIALGLTTLCAVLGSVIGTAGGRLLAGVVAAWRGRADSTTTRRTPTLSGILASMPPVHALSPVITGLILALVLLPVADAGLVGVALAGVLAGGSKYLLAWRGRHVLNPAVVGLLVAGWTGLAQAWWWIGSSVLFPFVVLAGLAVLWRTRRMLYAASYAVPAVALTVLGYVGLGTPGWTALSFAVLSGPIAFLACFMLTEPLTTPPRLLERVGVGVLVGVASAAPVLWGWGWLSPELALALGNVVAFGLGPRRRVALRFLRRAAGADDGLLDLRFAPSSPLRFRPGQYVEVDVPQALARPRAAEDSRGRRRVLSLASSPLAGEVRLVTRLAEPGAAPSPVKAALADLAPGDELGVTLVAGDFLLPEGRSALVGLGVGMTPFLAMLDDLARGGGRRPGADLDVVAVWAVKDVRDVLPILADPVPVPSGIPGGGVTGALPARVGLPHGVSLVLVVPPGADRSTLPAGYRVVEGSAVDAAVLAEAVPDLAERTVLVSGSPGSVAAVKLIAREQGARRVRTDVFLGY